MSDRIGQQRYNWDLSRSVILGSDALLSILSASFSFYLVIFYCSIHQPQVIFILWLAKLAIHGAISKCLPFLFLYKPIVFRWYVFGSFLFLSASLPDPHLSICPFVLLFLIIPVTKMWLLKLDIFVLYLAFLCNCPDKVQWILAY